MARGSISRRGALIVTLCGWCGDVMCQRCGRGRETTWGHYRVQRGTSRMVLVFCIRSLVWSRETRVSPLYGVLPVISPRGLTDDASLYLLNPRRLVCRGVVSRDVHTLRHITPHWGWSPGQRDGVLAGGGWLWWFTGGQLRSSRSLPRHAPWECTLPSTIKYHRRRGRGVDSLSRSACHASPHIFEAQQRGIAHAWRRLLTFVGLKPCAAALHVRSDE